jgi:quinol monooxygenase YgiN
VNAVSEDDRVFIHTEFSITAGKVDEFKKIAQELLEVVKEKEPNTLRYQWYFNKDQIKSYLVEEYPNAAAVRVHVIHVGIVIPKLLKISKISSSTVLGKLNIVAQEALTLVGAQHFGYWNGLVR